MTLAAWLHDLSPIIVDLPGGLALRWYGLAYVAGFAIAYFLMRAMARRGLVAVPHERVGDAILIFVAGVVVGGRLGYALFYRPSLLWTFTSDFPWWELLAIHEGGMASHGGMIGAIIAAFIVARGFKDERGVRRGRASPLHLMDIAALLVPFGLLLGRLANFVNGELLGNVAARPGEPAPWWSVRFPQEALSEWHDLTEAQQAAYAGLVGLGDVADRVYPGSTLWPEFYDRFSALLVDLQQGSATAAAQLAPIVSARHPSQLYQAAAEGLVVGAVVWWVARRPRVPGVIGCWFLISYGILRIVTELVRLPDSHLAEPRPFGLSRGQWLSLAMVLVGVVALPILARRGGPRIGGWATVRAGADGPGGDPR